MTPTKTTDAGFNECNRLLVSAITRCNDIVSMKVYSSSWILVTLWWILIISLVGKTRKSFFEIDTDYAFFESDLMLSTAGAATILFFHFFAFSFTVFNLVDSFYLNAMHLQEERLTIWVLGHSIVQDSSFDFKRRQMQTLVPEMGKEKEKENIDKIAAAVEAEAQQDKGEQE